MHHRLHPSLLTATFFFFYSPPLLVEGLVHISLLPWSHFLSNMNVALQTPSSYLHSYQTISCHFCTISDYTPQEYLQGSLQNAVLWCKRASLLFRSIIFDALMSWPVALYATSLLFLAVLHMLNISGCFKIQFMTTHGIFEHKKTRLGTFSVNFFDFNIIKNNKFSCFETANNFDFLAQ